MLLWVLFQSRAVPLRTAPKKELSFWVWHRPEAFSALERESLRRVSCTRVYWHAATVSLSAAGSLHASPLIPLPPGCGDAPRLVPVIRIDAAIRDPARIDPVALAGIAWQAGMSDEIQFDYDCPSRLLPEYARLLASFRLASGVRHMGVTALAGWIGEGDRWRAVERVVDEVCPMLYDIDPERAPAETPPDPVPLADAAGIAHWIREWSACNKPWLAGLPNFNRLSLFRGGRLLGQIREWTWEEIADPDRFESTRGKAPGITLLRALEPIHIDGHAILPGDWLALRQCEGAQLRDAAAASAQSRAAGEVWFVFPTKGLAAAAWNVGTIASRFHAQPELDVQFVPDSVRSGRFVLTNRGVGDLAPVVFNGGRVLRIDLPEGGLRHLPEGDFLAALSTGSDGRPAPSALASGVRLRFTGLRAGESMATGSATFHALPSGPLSWRLEPIQ